MNRATQTLRRASLTAGLSLTVMSLLAAFGVFAATAPLITTGDAAKTAQDILGSERLFRWGIASLILVVILDVVVAAALMAVFRQVSRNISFMAALFRGVYSAVYLVAILQLVLALDLLDEPEQAMRAVNAYSTIWLVGLILCGVHLLLIGYLAYTSGFMAKIFGILLVVAGLGYIADGFAAVLIPGPVNSIAKFTFVGEVALILWLLIVGRRRLVDSDQPAGSRPLDPASLRSRTAADPEQGRPVGAGGIQ